jgi:hypothetical protein
MYDEYDKCRFCKGYDLHEACELGCANHEEFEPDKNRIIEFAKIKGISVADAIALINL